MIEMILSRLSQAATYAAITAILAAFGYTVPPGILHDVMFIGMVASGIAAVVIKEGWRKAFASGDAVAALEARVAAIESATK
jgi:hypothetical protein